MRSHSRLFETALAGNSPIVLDGGLATELESQGLDIGTKLWSAGLLQLNPQAIVDAHLAFLEAGADIIISASYQASRAGFMSMGLSAPVGRMRRRCSCLRDHTESCGSKSTP